MGKFTSLSYVSNTVEFVFCEDVVLLSLFICKCLVMDFTFTEDILQAERVGVQFSISFSYSLSSSHFSRSRL